MTPALVTEAMRATLLANRRTVLAGLLAGWQQLDPANLSSELVEWAPEALALLAEGQARAAAAGTLYVARFVEASGQRNAEPMPLLPSAFAGATLDGRSLGRVLGVGALEARRRERLGEKPEQARDGAFLRVGRAASTELADAGREATAGAMLLDPHVDGYTRAVRLPACGRCLVLAGKRYKLDAGFARHPRCDCFQTPRLRSSDPVPDAEKLFARMSEAEQAKAIGAEAARRVREGQVSLSTVVNRTVTGVEAPKPAPRSERIKPTPLLLREQAKGDPDKYRRLMADAGYLST